MPIRDLYSYRQRVSDGAVPDVYVYDQLPQELRKQIVHIWRDAIGPWDVNAEAWTIIHDIVAREHGLLKLCPDFWHLHICDGERCEKYFLEQDSVEYALDVVEVSFKYVDLSVRNYPDHYRRQRGIKLGAVDAIQELNERFRRAGVGYRFEEGRIIRIDSELLHSEVTKPALRFLSEPGFEGPLDEFRKAHAHYRAGETKEAITAANNAFESTLKMVCDQRQLFDQPCARVSELLRIVRENGVLPSYLGKSFDQLAAVLQSGLPQVRNNEGAHGQGATPRETPDYVAAYALHLAAANILFIVKAHKAKG